MKRYIYIFCFSLSVVCLSAQNMKSVFTNMPDQYIPQLETAWRKDLIDLYTSGKEARLQNMMNGYSRLLTLTDDYLLLQVTERSTVELKLLPLVNNTHIVCMVSTVEGPVADSKISFYSTEWEPIPSEDLLVPVSADRFFKEDTDMSDDKLKDAKARLDMDLIKYQLHPNELSLTVTYTTPLYLSPEEREKTTPFLKDSAVVYVWEKFRFN